jgi:hypothetical protein
MAPQAPLECHRRLSPHNQLPFLEHPKNSVSTTVWQLDLKTWNCSISCVLWECLSPTPLQLSLSPMICTSSVWGHKTLIFPFSFILQFIFTSPNSTYHAHTILNVSDFFGTSPIIQKGDQTLINHSDTLILCLIHHSSLPFTHTYRWHSIFGIL